MIEALHPSSTNKKVMAIVIFNRTIVAISVITLVASMIVFGTAMAYLDLIVALPSLMIGFWLIVACILTLIGVTKANYVLMLIGAIGT